MSNIFETTQNLSDDPSDDPHLIRPDRVETQEGGGGEGGGGEGGGGEGGGGEGGGGGNPGEDPKKRNAQRTRRKGHIISRLWRFT